MIIQVRKLYERIQRNERNRIEAAVAAAAPISPASAAAAAPSPPDSPSRAPPPSFVPTPRGGVSGAGTARVVIPGKGDFGEAIIGGGRDDGGSSAIARRPVIGDTGVTTTGAGGRKRVERLEYCGPVVGGSGGAVGVCESGGCRGGGDGKVGGGGGGQTGLQIGERLQEAVRLCSVGGGGGGGGVSPDGTAGNDSPAAVPAAPSALTLSEAELSRPRRLLEALRLFSCRDGDGDGEAVEVGIGPDKEGVTTPDGKGEAATGGGFLGHSLTEEESRRTASLPAGEPLVETAWLAQRFPRATLGDLLVNRLELSLWASYWGRERPAGSVG